MRIISITNKTAPIPPSTFFRICCFLSSLKIEQLNKVSILEVVQLMRDSAHIIYDVCRMANSQCFSAALFQRLKINIHIHYTSF